MATFNLERSLFFPASGLDFEPLRRFSNLCDTFVFADWGYQPDEVEAAVERLGGGLELAGEPQVIGKAELGEDAALPPGFRLLPEERVAYESRVGEVLVRLVPWAREFRLRRHFGEVERELTLVYVAAEGLATYAAVYGQHGAVPLVLCAIQSSSGFENPGGTMERLIEAYQQRPHLWIRGKMAKTLSGPHHSPADSCGLDKPHASEGGEHADLDDEDAFANCVASRWKREVQNYAGWHTGHQLAVVKAFAREGADFGLERSAELEGSNRMVKIDRTAWTAEELGGFEACFLTRPVVQKLQLKNAPEVRVWEKPLASIVDYLTWIDDECERSGWKRVAAVPVGYEDEAEYLRHWLQRDGLPQHLTIRFVHELDFADLRGWLSVHSGD